MRTIKTFNDNWTFSKPGEAAVSVTLPHTWNAEDGTDGGADYYRGSCTYTKAFAKGALPAGERVYLEVNGANSSADVVLNGKTLAHHDGGYSTFRVDLTDAIAEDNELVITVDNAPNETVYPQMADFTFYGGLYRDVNLIAVSEVHFDLMHHGGPGFMLTPVVEGRDARVSVKAWTKAAGEGHQVRVTISDADGSEVASETAQISADGSAEVTLMISGAHLWHARKDPYLYSATLTLCENDAPIDEVCTRFGVRSYTIDAEKGFLLNGEPYPLHGVSRHQDKLGKGNALSYEDHREDIDLIAEMGATSIRLAHYQHARAFYDLCDEYGFVVWAEIPYISRHMPGGRENTLSQMRELVIQNYNHPSIVVWGLSNEITMGGAEDPDLLENHRELNALVKELDPTRPTTMAVVSMCDIHASYLDIPDVIAYNHYYGWYGGDTSMNGPWLDRFHKERPQIPIGLSEYGCEGLNWHNSTPDQGDYTEEYQAYYHEELIKQLYTRDYVWSTYVWNMFDFGCDARSEGGEPGQNHKGLVTFDRKYKKDAYYAYKAWLSDEPFVHICGKRYVDRVEDVTKVTVYSNQKTVELFANGTSLGVKEAADHFFYFEVPNAGETELKAVAGDCTDVSRIRKVDTFNEEYRLKEVSAILNWFEVEAPEGYLSLNDKFSEIMKTEAGRAIVGQMMQKMASGQREGMPKLETADMMQMLGGFTVLRMVSLMGITGAKPSKEELLALNAQLNKIKKA